MNQEKNEKESEPLKTPPVSKFWLWLVIAVILTAGLGFGAWYYNYVYKQKISINPSPLPYPPITQSSARIEGEFCGTSTYGSCNNNSDCKVGGCSGQVCQGQSEEPEMTTCEFRDCYSPQKYNLSCQCQNQQCHWSEQ